MGKNNKKLRIFGLPVWLLFCYQSQASRSSKIQGKETAQKVKPEKDELQD
jgi:hypothetical protein